MELTLLPRLGWNPWKFCFNSPSAGITGADHHAGFQLLSKESPYTSTFFYFYFLEDCLVFIWSSLLYFIQKSPLEIIVMRTSSIPKTGENILFQSSNYHTMLYSLSPSSLSSYFSLPSVSFCYGLDTKCFLQTCMLDPLVPSWCYYWEKHETFWTWSLDDKSQGHRDSIYDYRLALSLAWVIAS